MTIKLVGFDWDGTLVRMPMKYSWRIIDSALGCTEAGDAIAEKYKHNTISYLEWCEECVDLYRKSGLTEKMLKEIVDKNVTLHKGALETIGALKSRGIKVGIISGGMYNMYEYASDKFGLSVDYADFAARLKFDDRGALVGGEYRESDFDGKLRVLKEYCKRAKATLEETLYVGDSHNDIPVFEAATGIAFSSDSEELKRHAKYILKGDDLRGILKYVA
jgi:HAD superfamily phosphoserine phosphatase-like hydrolase